MKFSLKGIIAISGKPGLYKVVAQGNQNLIVESLIDKKRSPAHSSNKISSLDEITMYTTSDEDAALPEIIQRIFEKENGGKSIDPKDEANHRSYFKEIVPDYDEEKVYGSDIKKLFAWYSLLLSSGELARIAEEAKKAAEEEGKEEKTEKKEKAVKAEKPAKAEKAEKAEKSEKAEKTTTKKKAAEKTEEKAEAKKTEKKPAAKAKATTKAKTDAKPKVKIKADSKAKATTVRKSGGQRGS